ncbi:MAG: 16S rRNA (guanine(966)-N(2))-methyltransferase RsmD [Halorhodospira sp.]
MSRRRGGQLRIIGGQWRGRKLPVPTGGEGVRPTGDRVRETLFNWLAPALPGTRCLDLFAGTGALGLEALSRGAAEAVLVERDPQAAAGLRRNLAALGAEGGRVEAVDALAYLRRPPAAAFEVAFLDPPYEADLLPACCQALVDGGWLVAGAQVYIESRAGAGLPQLPATWELRREGRAGRCRYRLLRAGGATATEE